ncbi:hypothetical protein BDN72DRAFT_957832 [Pluteus cervinus]|uniref:Uncharacterized protein n=1 Tax=Pluteus cervinus TaxID=181527 RepID=A0ACD3B1V7_9AGAR|nr:hypothetical protein BDN72DRAFT_957832 [Pluteus cervinus]
MLFTTTARVPSSQPPRPRKPTLLVVFVHGFIGTEESFSNFPSDLQQVLKPLTKSRSVKCEVYPSYQTKGDFNQAVLSFSRWLKNLVRQRETDRGYCKNADGVKVVLCGHSMGGMLIADALLHLHVDCLHRGELWPRIIACIAFDSPFFGVDPVSVLEALAPVQATLDLFMETADSIKFELPVIGGPATAMASRTLRYAVFQYAFFGLVLYIGGKCLYKVSTAIADYWKFIRCTFEGTKGNLIGATVKVAKLRNVRFSVLYAAHNPPSSSSMKTFVCLPDRKDPAFKHFHPIHNTRVNNVIQGHISMFTPKSNSAYSSLVKDVAKKIGSTLFQNV